MPGLRELQEAFQARVLGGADDAIDARIRGDARADAAERLGIYVDAYRLRLAEVLCNDYPVLAACLGDPGFGDLARAYTDAHPSRHPSVRWFGHALAEFLRDTAPWRARPALAELARFEWTQGELSDADDDLSLDMHAVASIEPARWPAMRFTLRAAVRLVTLEHNVAAAVRDFNDDGALPALEALPCAGTWLMWRGDDMIIRWRALDEDECDALEVLAAGGDFEAICERVAARADADDAGQRAAGLLKQWLSDAVIAGVTVPRDL